jgi:hypothetical protein
MGPCNKRVAILLPTVWSIRNVVTSGLAENLAASGVSVTLLPWRTDHFESILPPNVRVAVEPLLSPQRRRGVRGATLLKQIQATALEHRHRLDTQWPTKRRQRPKGLALGARRLLVDALGRASQPALIYGALSWVRRWIYQREYDRTQVLQQVEELKPDLICCTACLDSREHPYVHEAEILGIPTVGCIQSFDNLTTRPEMPVFEYYVVWNASMRNTLLEVYPRVDPKSVFITGTPQFDFHRRPEFRWTREETLERLRLPPKARYVLYAANHHTWTPTEPELISAFAARLAGNADLSRVWIVVRLHPLDDLSRWQQFPGEGKKVTVQSPWSQSPDNVCWALVGPEDQRLLVSSLAHSEMCVNMCSTMSLDAAILDRPVIGMAFAARPGSLEDRIYREAYDSLHYRSLVESGGLRLARDWDELLTLVRRALRSPELDREERRRMVERECGIADGRAGERVKDVLISLLNNKREEDATEAYGR